MDKKEKSIENQKRNKPSVSFTLLPEVNEKLEELSRRLGTSKSSIVSMAIVELYETKVKQIGEKKIRFKSPN